MAVNDPRPITLRPADMADDIPSMTFELAKSLRDVMDEAVAARDLLRRAIDRADMRLRDRAHLRLMEHVETVDSVLADFETLARTLRATGRL